MVELTKKPMTSGGKRPGAGRKDKYGEKTKVVAFKVPESKAEVFKKKANKILERWEIKKKKKS